MTFKKIALAVASATALLCGSHAHATVTAYGFTVSGPWFDNSGMPYGMPFSPSLSGSITIDDSFSGIAAMTGFSITTGSKTWTLADFTGAGSSTLAFDGLGNLTNFSLSSFADGSGGSMYIYSNNTMGVNDGQGGVNACNGCVSLGAGVPVTPSVPEPANVALALAGLGVVGWRLRGRVQAQIAA